MRLLTSDDTSHLSARRLRAQYSLSRGGWITLVSQPDTSGCTRALNLSPERLFLILEAECLRSSTGLRGLELRRVRQMKASACKLLAKWLDICAGSSGTLH